MAGRRHRPKKTALIRFWEKVKEDGDCLIWTGGGNQFGYGLFRVNGEKVLVTHYVWFLTNGEWPKLKILHKCDNPPCVKIEHLFEGTQGDNIRDAWAKGRKRYSQTYYNR